MKMERNRIEDILKEEREVIRLFEELKEVLR